MGILLFSINALATVHTVSVGDFAFAPNSLSIRLGDTIRWNWANGLHTTTSTSVPAGAATWDFTLQSTSTSFIYVPTVEGTYNYKCSFHESMGMLGSFTVIGPSTVKANPDKFFAVSPNPAKSEIKINSAGLKLQVSIADALGRQVILNPLSEANNEQTYSIKHLSSGIYMLVIRADESVTVQKLFIE